MAASLYEIFDKGRDKAVEPGRAVVGGQIHVGHTAHLFDICEKIFRARPYYDVGAHSMLGEPFGLRIYGGCAHASGHEEHSGALQLFFRKVKQIGGAAKRTGKVNE